MACIILNATEYKKNGYGYGYGYGLRLPDMVTDMGMGGDRKMHHHRNEIPKITDATY